MEHVVFFPAPDGTPAFRRLASLDEAVRLVEHLRNVEGVAQVSVHALTEVPLSFRAYYRVEVPSAPEAPQEPKMEVPMVEVPMVEVPMVEVPMVEVPAQAVPVVEPVAEPEPVAVAEVAPEPPVLALVGDLPVEVPELEEPAAYTDEPAPEYVSEYVPEPALASAHGRGGPASLGFFA